ncbi:MAG: ROK family protein, partial [Actinobacteria bacterium]|nr:ROK family protein [Actinomycetota bacterium]
MYIIGKPKLIRQINSSLLLKNIRDKKVFTKSELYVSSNLSRQTINNIVITLIKKDLVEEIGYGSSTLEGGKKPTLYKFNADG